MRYYQLKNRLDNPIIFSMNIADSINKQVSLEINYNLHAALTLESNRVTLRLASRLHRT